MDLGRSVEDLKGVGPKTAETLRKAGILTVRDLLYYLPRTYENYQVTKKIAEIRPGKVVIRGKISDLTKKRTRRRNLSMIEGVIRDRTGAVRVVWFNQPYRLKQFIEGKEYIFSGSYDFKYGKYQLTSPTAVLATDVEESGELQPIYPAKGSLKPQQFKKFFGNLRLLVAQTPDLLPKIGDRLGILRDGVRADALMQAHYPQTIQEAEQGRRYLAYEELFEIILAAKLNKKEAQRLPAIPLKFDAEKTRALVGSLAFNLTNAQRRAAWEILQNLGEKRPMNRLLQGDVGSGKTVVAAISAQQVANNGFQTAFLAPTAILANQHAEGLERVLGPLGVKIGLLTGATKNKTELKKQIKTGEVDIVVGTHALLTDDTEFANLALCIIDEQHRFGVDQRRKLLLKSPDGVAPHLLTMTATPIPRSLQLTIFGDLEVSVLNELPKGRKPIKTKILNEVNLRDELYPLITEEMNARRQIYWICKAIEDNPQTETISVKKQAEKLKKVFPKAKIEFLHGRMKTDEKDEIMGRFSKGETDILVSTTVVEVGVDVPNASVIVIMDAEGYGLAQLHQLRGRVGRGSAESYCFLVVSGEEPPSRRLKELEKSTDGFHLAEVDLKLRGPGEIYGSLQHGAMDLRIATLSDHELVNSAAKQVTEFLSSIRQNKENMVKYKELSEIIKKYQQLTTLN